MQELEISPLVKRCDPSKTWTKYLNLRSWLVTSNIGQSQFVPTVDTFSLLNGVSFFALEYKNMLNNQILGSLTVDFNVSYRGR